MDPKGANIVTNFRIYASTQSRVISEKRVNFDSPYLGFLKAHRNGVGAIQKVSSRTSWDPIFRDLRLRVPLLYAFEIVRENGFRRLQPTANGRAKSGSRFRGL